LLVGLERRSRRSLDIRGEWYAWEEICAGFEKGLFGEEDDNIENMD
jgi:hypothetical protein